MPAPRVTIDELPEQTVPQSSDLLVVQNGAVTKKMQISALTTSSAQPLTDHINDASGAHAASAVAATPNTAPMSGTDVQTQLGQAAAGLTGLTDHLADPAAAHAALAVSFTPVGQLTADNVQDAIAQVDDIIVSGGGIPDGDKGDIIVSGTGATWMFDTTVITTAARTVLDDTTMAAMRDTLGAAPAAQPIDEVTGTTYTAATADANKIKRLTATATVTLPSGGPVVGDRVDFVSVGGPATFTLGAGATWDVPPTPSAVARTVGSVVSAVKMGATSWMLTGDLA